MAGVEGAVAVDWDGQDEGVGVVRGLGSHGLERNQLASSGGKSWRFDLSVKSGGLDIWMEVWDEAQDLLVWGVCVWECGHDHGHVPADHEALPGTVGVGVHGVGVWDHGSGDQCDTEGVGIHE